MQEHPITPALDYETRATTAEKLETQSTPDSEKHVGLSLRKRYEAHFLRSVETKAGYIPVLACCFTTGLTDGTVYNGKGQNIEIR